MNRVVNSEMIFLARESRGFSQSEFAKVVGISQATVSRYEGNLLEVAPDHLEKIAEALGYPTDFFYQSETLYGFGSSCESYHRKRQSLPVRDLRKIHAKINLFRIQIGRMLRNADIDAENRFHRMDIDGYGTPERIAMNVRSSWHMPIGPARSMIGAIESAGGIVFCFPFGTKRFDAVSQWPPGSPPLFFVNSEAPADRVRFTLAHELGHIVMHESPSENLEEEANRFAAEFLMPERDIGPDLSPMSLQRAAAMKSYWKTSMAAIIKHARTLNRITDWQYKSLFTQLSKLGYRTNEPNPIPHEKPSIISQLLEVHFRDYGYSTNDFCRLLAVFEAEFRRDYLQEEGSHLKLVH